MVYFHTLKCVNMAPRVQKPQGRLQLNEYTDTLEKGSPKTQHGATEGKDMTPWLYFSCSSPTESPSSPSAFL